MSGINFVSNVNTNIQVSKPSQAQTQITPVSQNTGTPINSTSVDSNLTQSIKKGSVPVLEFTSKPAAPEYKTEELKNEKEHLTIQYPQFTNLENKEVEASINKQLKDKATEAFTTKPPQGEAEEGDIMGGMPNFETGVGESSRTSNTLTVNTYDYTYEEGAAHGMSMVYNTNFDLNTGKQIELKELFKPDSKYLEKISKFATGNLEHELGKDGLLKEGVSPTEDNFNNFKIKDDAIEFQFQTYQISSSYGAGTPKVSIPLDVLANEINPASVLGDKVKTDLKTTEYSGKINNKYAIEANIKFDDSSNKIVGDYKYAGKKDEINVTGRVAQDGSFKLTESSNGVETGSFNGKFSEDKASAKGTWTNVTGKKSMPFELKIK